MDVLKNLGFKYIDDSHYSPHFNPFEYFLFLTLNGGNVLMMQR